MSELPDIRQLRSARKKQSPGTQRRSPVILACDTSTTVGSAAIVEGGLVTAETMVKSKISHSLRILKDIEAMLLERELRMADIDAFVTAGGPGSFTGVRIAMATMKGLAWSLNKPLITIGTLRGLAWPLLKRGLPVMTALDARRHEVYGALFASDGTELVAQAATAPSDLARACIDVCGQDVGIICAGEGIGEYEDCFLKILGDRMVRAPAHEDYVRASVLGIMGTSEYAAGRFSDLAAVEPVYLRRSEAEINLENKSNQAG